ncbi:MAG: Dipeptidylaminopeptidase/acylaminoacyl-peptidase [Candidatus Gottesmanbacteria bacterium GW2011_GWA2_43_14]|uniref:Dipeptidylaminopeptidase/acylaminoacyl-peptidase n=1 Tax=Candidatus Gottesmanbacteria bacterium GW2011_GWA2_43_14 TaxID=1618443 RepID=A0A0G1DKP1_9BACT|nr:MAG: Dipeptidylaminopeptidase/acylaminoacyl-peptidase [Candidatus Gottesmanbacteria bacterium GW2011_GWA2_43_14]
MLKKKNIILLTSFFLLTGVLIRLYFVLQSETPIKTVLNSRQIFNRSNPGLSPTPMPFSELTIDYLRTREYVSSLGSLNQLNDFADYTSYLTSFDSEGFKVNALMTRPKGLMPAGGWPAVIFIHGYIQPRQYSTSQNYYDYVDYLARNALAVFKIDLRGHGTSEGEPGGAYYNSDYIIDVLNAYSALGKADFINGNKIGLWGHSMAGNVVMRSLAAKPSIPAAVIWAGAVYTYTDLAEYGIDDNSYRPPENDSERQRRRRELFANYGQPAEGHAFWKLVAPTNYLSDLKGAVEIHHAVNDNVVDIGYSRNLSNLLKEAGIPAELHEYNSGGHNLTGPVFGKAMQRTVNFFLEYLK